MSRRASGLKAWLLQRVSAVYLALFGLYLVLYFIVTPPPDHAALAAWATSPWVGLGLLLFIPMLVAHAWVGIRDVIIDYVKPTGLRIGLLSAMALMFLASGLWALQALILIQVR
jgi:succinate dehydrogenase / fumarate reductase membrane anchor subunit